MRGKERCIAVYQEQGQRARGRRGTRRMLGHDGRAGVAGSQHTCGGEPSGEPSGGGRGCLCDDEAGGRCWRGNRTVTIRVGLRSTSSIKARPSRLGVDYRQITWVYVVRMVWPDHVAMHAIYVQATSKYPVVRY